LPIKLAHAETENLYEQQDKAVYQNTSGIPAQSDYEAYLEKESSAKRRSVGNNKSASLATYSGGYCSCIKYAQSIGLGISGYGYARNYPVNSHTPAQSGFVLTRESVYGHIAYYVLQGGNLVLQEANYSKCRLTTGRILPVNSSLIRGYIN
jgi:hypothetical protein